MTDEHIIQAARALGYQNDGLYILMDGRALLYIYEGTLRVSTSDLDKAEEAVRAARAIQKMTSSEWDDLIKLAEWAKTRNAP